MAIAPTATIANIAGCFPSIEPIYKNLYVKANISGELAALRGKWIDQSQSLNLFVRGTSGRQLSDLYLAAWRQDLKTTYYLRTLGASQVEKSTLDAARFGFTQKRAGEGDAADALVAPDALVPLDAPDAPDAPVASAAAACRLDDTECLACQ